MALASSTAALTIASSPWIPYFKTSASALLTDTSFIFTYVSMAACFNFGWSSIKFLCMPSTDFYVAIIFSYPFSYLKILAFTYFLFSSNNFLKVVISSIYDVGVT